MTDLRESLTEQVMQLLERHAKQPYSVLVDPRAARSIGYDRLAERVTTDFALPWAGESPIPITGEKLMVVHVEVAVVRVPASGGVPVVVDAWGRPGAWRPTEDDPFAMVAPDEPTKETP